MTSKYEHEFGGRARLWTGEMEVERQALEQVRKMTQLPILAGHVAIMPDVHFGIGATVGTVIPTRAAIIPAAVGVDIGCGMLAAQLNLKAADLPDDLKAIRHQIERDIPVGFDVHKELHVPRDVYLVAGAHLAKFDRLRIHALREGVGHDKMHLQVGTLGGGNHFIELCLDKDQNVWLMLHSGSRGIGNVIGRAAIEMAKEVAARLGRDLPDQDLAWLDEGTPEFEAYIEAMEWAQRYAHINRHVMGRLAVEAISRVLSRAVMPVATVVNCHHNYSSVEEHFGEKIWVTRKGAVHAGAGVLGIIPGSMGARSFIVRGKGNPDSYCSCSHGAGRRMSRGAAKRAFGVADVEAQTAGVECRKDEGVIDEIPAAYKSIEEVMAAQTDLVEVVAELRQVLCVKG